MSTERSYKQVKKELRKEFGLSSKDKRINFHHNFERRDKKEGRLPEGFSINTRFNITPLFIGDHEYLHFLDDKYFHERIDTRVYLANMAFNNELDLVPDRLFSVMPKIRNPAS